MPERVPRGETEVEHHPGAPEGMLPALASVGLYKIEPRERVPRPPPKPVREPSTPIYLTVERRGRVKYLPEEARLLSVSDTAYLKERYLKGLDGYEDVEGFNAFFADASALKSGEYGGVFYASMGTNPWAKVYKVIVERALT